MTIAEFATKRVVSTTMIIIFMIFAGYSAMKNMKQELIPDFNFPFVVVQTKWTGATSEDVDTQITKRIEEASLNVDGIKNITTTSNKISKRFSEISNVNLIENNGRERKNDDN